MPADSNEAQQNAPMSASPSSVGPRKPLVLSHPMRDLAQRATSAQPPPIAILHRRDIYSDSNVSPSDSNRVIIRLSFFFYYADSYSIFRKK